MEGTCAAREETTDEQLSMGISPGPRDTRVIAMAGPSETILKARLLRQPSPPAGAADAAGGHRALAGSPGPRCALCGRPGWGVRLEPLSRSVPDFGGPLYTLEWVPAGALGPPPPS
jgi:hypothetical protein